MKTLIFNVNIVSKDNIMENSCLVFSDGIIEYVGKEPLPADATIDGEGNYLIPGFIDLHCHGGNGCDFLDGTEQDIRTVLNHHLKYGTTTVLATITTTNYDLIKERLQVLSNYKSSNMHSTLYGVHLEGPWLNHKQCGAQNIDYMRKPSAEDLKQLKNDFNFIYRASGAPELDDEFKFASMGVELGIKMSFAHTDADFSIIEKAKEKGYKIATHLYSGMKGVFRKDAVRTAGAVEAALYFDDIVVEVIADGKHLPLELLRYIYKIKGADGICLVTDSTRGSGLPNGTSTIGAGPKETARNIIIEDDVAKTLDRQSFAGSVSTTDRLYRTMAQAIGKDFVALSKMSSLTPARIMGLTDRGEIKEGKVSDLILIDKDLNIKRVITNKEN